MSDPDLLAEFDAPLIRPTGFREYDVRWRYPEEINLAGMEAVGLGLATQLHEVGGPNTVTVGNDYRAYAPAVKHALMLGLIRGGAEVLDIGTCLSPMVYFAQGALGTHGAAMVTASHNPNGWTGVKMSMSHPLTHGPAEMAQLRDIVLGGAGVPRSGGSWRRVEDLPARYLDDVAGDFRLSRPLKVVVACGNGTAGAFAPALLRRIGADVIERHCMPDHTFPNYNPNPEALEMLHDMAAAVAESDADVALGFDGDGDRCGVVDETGAEIFADKIGVLLARIWAGEHPDARFVVDVKSTGLYAADPVLKTLGATTEYWKTGHSHMKRRVHETGAIAGFEKSGHYYLAPPVGPGYDCGLRAAMAICMLLDRAPDRSLSQLAAELPASFITPTLSPHCPDEEKYAVVDRLTDKLTGMAQEGAEIGPRRIVDVVTVNGARVMFEGGAWALVRASSNTPNLVVVCESFESDAELREIFAAFDALIRTEPAIGAYDQAF